MMGVACGAVMTRKVVSKTSKPNSKCDRIVYLHPAIDRQFMIGECGKCGAGKIVRLKDE